MSLHHLYYVYMLECSDKSIYTGITNNIDRRLVEHQSGKDKNSYTYSRRPVKLIFHQEFNDVLQAIYFEKKIKKWSRKKKLALANGDFDMLKILSECRNATHYKYKPGSRTSTALSVTHKNVTSSAVEKQAQSRS